MQKYFSKIEKPKIIIFQKIGGPKKKNLPSPSLGKIYLRFVRENRKETVHALRDTKNLRIILRYVKEQQVVLVTQYRLLCFLSQDNKPKKPVFCPLWPNSKDCQLSRFHVDRMWLISGQTLSLPTLGNIQETFFTLVTTVLSQNLSISYLTFS